MNIISHLTINIQPQRKLNRTPNISPQYFPSPLRPPVFLDQQMPNEELSVQLHPCYQNISKATSHRSPCHSNNKTAGPYCILPQQSLPFDADIDAQQAPNHRLPYSKHSPPPSGEPVQDHSEVSKPLLSEISPSTIPQPAPDHEV